MAYGAGLFVAVGQGGAERADLSGHPWIEASTDGINWKHVDIPYDGVPTYPEPILQSITYGDSGFVTTDGVHVLHSATGLNWTVDSFQDTTDHMSYVIYDGTRYILYSSPSGPYSVGINDNLPWKVSTDGVNWTDYGTLTVTNGPPGEPVSIIHVAGMYEAAWQPAQSVVATGPIYLTATSPDGLSWTLGTPVPVTYLHDPPTMPPVPVMPAVYDIVYAGDQYLLFGGTDESPALVDSWGVALHGSSLSAMTVVSPLIAANGANFYPTGEPLHGNPYETHGLVSNGTVTVGLGEGGLFVTTDGITWNFEHMEGVVPETGCGSDYPGTPTCTAFASGAAAPGGSIVVLVTDGSAGAVTTDGVHWVKSNL